METSVVRNRLRDTIERAKRHAAERRSRNEEASRVYREFLDFIAVPLMRQLANALRAAGHQFSVLTPSDSVRLVSDRHAEDFIDIALDISGDTPQVMGHVSRLWASNVIVREQTVGSGRPDGLTEEELLDFLLKELEPFVER